MAAATDTAGSDNAYAELDDDEAAIDAYVAEAKRQLAPTKTNDGGSICPLQPPHPRQEESIDGLDDYGNPLQPGAAPPPSGSLHRKRKLNVVPPKQPEPWANSDETVPQQPYSFTGMAALQVNRVYTALTLPQCTEEVDPQTVAHVLDQLGMRPAAQGVKKGSRLALDTPLAMVVSHQTRLFQDGYSAAHELTVLRSEAELTALKRAEYRELHSAADGDPSPDGTLAARPMAITVLCIGPSTALNANQKMLLDAAAHLASEPGQDEECAKIRAASQVRMSFLYGNAAKEYARSRSADIVTTQCEGLRHPCNEVCVTWTEAIPVNEVDEAHGCRTHLRPRMRSEFFVLQHSASAEEYVQVLLSAVTKLWCDSGIVPGPLRLMASYAACGSPVHAYARHRIACARDFCDELEPCHKAELSDYVTKDPRYSGALEWTHQWAKIVPRDEPLDGPNVSHGLLFHQQGYRDEAREYICRVREEEAQKQVDGCFGLRGPLDTTEMATCMHVVLANADRLNINDQLSCFGLRSVAGMSLGSVLPCLSWRLLPLTEELKEKVFVVPCHEELIYSAQQESIQPLRESTQRAVDAYNHLLKNGLATNAPTRLPSPPPIAARERTPHEAMIAMLLGLPLTCKAFRIGDVANALQGASPEAAQRAVIPSGLSRFFVSAAVALGTEESVNLAFEWACTNAERVVQLANDMETLTDKVHALEIELKVARAMPPTPPVDAEPSVQEDADDQNPVELDVARRGELLRSWNRAADFSGALCYTLKDPIQGKSLRMVLASLGAAAEEVDESVQQAAYEWAKSNCCKKSLNDCDRIARTCHHALTLSGEATGNYRRAFLVCTSKTAESVTTVVDIDLDQPTGEGCWKTIDWTSGDSWCSDGVARQAVVLAWFADERGLAVLPVCDDAEDDTR